MKRLLIIMLMLCSCGYAQTPQDRLADISDAKAAIKTAIESKGVTVGTAPFSDYADKIALIRTAYDGQSVDAYLAIAMATGDIAYIVTDYIHRTIAFDSAPSTVNNVGITGLAMSQDGSMLVTKPRGTGSVLNSFKWDATDMRYEKTAAVSGSVPVQTYQVAMTRDGSKIAVGSTNAAASLGWNAGNNRYEIHTTPDTLPITGYGAALSDDGNRLVLTDNNAGATKKVLTYVWDSGDNRYEITTSPNAEPTGQPYRCAMSGNGDYLAVAHTGTGAPAKLTAYKWSTGNNRYELTGDNTATIGGTAVGVGMSADGSKIVVGNTASPYIVSMTWNAGNNRYEPDGAVSYNNITAPAGSCFDVDMSDDGSIVVASFLASTTAGIPYFVTFEWQSGDGLYKAISARRYGTPDGAFTAAATISGNGLFAASSHAENATPVYTYHIATDGANLAYKYTNPLADAATFSADINFFGFAASSGVLGQNKQIVSLWWRSEYIFDELTQTIMQYLGDDKTLEIPEQLEGLDVLVLGENSFRDKYLDTVTLPPTITSIGTRAFSNAIITWGDFNDGLASVTFPAGLVSIGDYAFSNNSLTELTLPSSVTTLGSGTFSYNNFTSITIPDTITSMRNSFQYCPQLTSVTMGSGLTAVPAYAFYLCASLTTVVVPEGYTAIGQKAFSATNIQSITLPSTITTIGDYAFHQCKLTSIVIPSGVTVINDSAFRSNSLVSITLPSGLLSIAAAAFASNSGLTSIVIPSSVTSIGSGAFESAQLTTITIGANVAINASEYTMGANQGFKTVYDNGGQLAGTYNYTGGTWVKE